MSTTLPVVVDDDHIRKPHNPQCPDAPVEAQRFAGFILEHPTRQLTRPDGVSLTLPRSDYQVLCELLAASNRVVSRDRLTLSAFGREHLPDDRSVDMCISRLRQQLRRAPGAGVQILTLRNEGYLLSIARTEAG